MPKSWEDMSKEEKLAQLRSEIDSLARVTKWSGPSNRGNQKRAEEHRKHCRPRKERLLVGCKNNGATL